MEGTTMRRTTRIFLFIVIWTLTSFAQQQGTERFARVINRLVEAMNKQDYAGIVREYDAGMSTKFPLTNTTLLFKNYESQYGRVTRVDSPQVKAIDQAVCVIYFEQGAQDLTLYINDQEKIKGFIFTTHAIPEPQTIQEPKPAPTPTTTQTTNPVQTVESKPALTQTSAKITNPIPAVEPKPAPTQTSAKITNPIPTVEPKPIPTQTIPSPSLTTSTPTTSPIVKQPVAHVVSDKQQTELYPPFKGTWTVLAGGEFREGTVQNNLLQQQYAYEFSAKDTLGSRYKNDGKANEDYFGYGKEVLAPANGTVVEAIDGIRENSPGSRNPYAPIGNTIIIQHSNREYSVLAFLKQGSIRVRVGDKVTRGQVIAQCGGSGSATEPVIHYHLQDSPYLQTAKGIKFYFERAMVTKEGKKELKLIHLPGIGETINLE
jgi:murein DD-endopeptidase MepM/ murein hydrolase activator NlpD